MEKKKILVYSDCYIYGGSERLMSFLMKNKILKESFNLNFFFRSSKEYNNGMVIDFEKVLDANKKGLPILSNETIFHRINCLNVHSGIKLLLKLPLVILQKFQLYSLWNLVFFLMLLKRERPDVIHINNGGYPAAKSCNLLVLANALFWKAKIIYQVNNQATMPRGIFAHKIDSFIDSKVNIFITASTLAKATLVERRKFDANSIKVISNCVERVEPAASRTQIFQSLNIPSNVFLIAQVAFLTKRKGQGYLIKALSLIFKTKPDLKKKITLILIGDGEDEFYLNGMIKDMDLEKNVLLLGYKANSEDYINASDVFVLPSISNEDMPLVILTALQLGKPIIASKFAGIAQVINNEENGLLIDLNMDNFVENLSNSIYRIYEDKALGNRLAESAKISYEAFTPEKYGENLKEIYSNV